MAVFMDQQDDAAPTLPRNGSLLLLSLTLLLLIFRAGAVPLVGPDEPRYARVAVEMSRSGDLVTPTLQGQPWLEKPILYYWLAAGAFRALGENETAARLPSLLATLALVLATTWLGTRLYGRRAGLHGGFILATSVLVFAEGRAATMDMLLTATLTAGIGCLALRWLDRAGPAASVAGAASLGLAVLAKGPLGIVLPGLIAVVYLAITRRWPRVRPAEVALAGAAFLAVALPWYLLIWHRQGQAFIDTFFLNHNLERFTSTVHRHPGPFYYYLPVLLVGLFPWSGLLLPAFARLRRAVAEDALLVCWVLVPLAFFSVAGSKLPGYILPVVPPLAILMGRGAVALIDDEALRPGLGPTGAAFLGLLLGFAVFGATTWLLWTGDPEARALLPVGVWALMLTWLVVRVMQRSPVEALRTLRVGAPGLLVLVALAAPPFLAHHESGRDLFHAAEGREVLVWGAWRTAWMSGYFYNDGRVREVTDPAEITSAASHGPVLALCGPEQHGQLQWTPGIHVEVLSEGPRHGRGPESDVLLSVRERP
jgi:4-amino-4-deoxy-L-arabinose transferase-like glycosyltransferase